MADNFRWAASEAEGAQVAKIWVEAATNARFEVRVELVSGRNVRGRILECTGRVDHAARRSGGALLIESSTRQQTWHDLLDIRRIARAPGARD